MRKHSKFAPVEGNCYDGIYKVVKYWPERGQSGFKVWWYLVRRDDSNSAPWTKEGRAIMQRNGYTCIFPDGYMESLSKKEKTWQVLND